MSKLKGKVATYSFGSMIPFKQAGWYIDDTFLLTQGEGRWIGDFGGRDPSNKYRWYGPGPPGNFDLEIPEGYTVDKEWFQELDEKKLPWFNKKLVWKTATLNPVSQGILDARLNKQEEKRKDLAEKEKEKEAARLQSQQARAEQPTYEQVRQAKVKATGAAYTAAIAAGKNEADAISDAADAADAAVAALKASYPAAKEGGRRRSRRRQRKQRRSRKRL